MRPVSHPPVATKARIPQNSLSNVLGTRLAWPLGFECWHAAHYCRNLPESLRRRPCSYMTRDTSGQKQRNHRRLDLHQLHHQLIFVIFHTGQCLHSIILSPPVAFEQQCPCLPMIGPLCPSSRTSNIRKTRWCLCQRTHRPTYTSIQNAQTQKARLFEHQSCR